MPAREDGEYELILGNKQLLGVLFIVIVLLGVFFAMGFLAGRSTSSSAADTAASRSGELIPIDGNTPTKTAKAEPVPTPEPPPAETRPAPEPATPTPPAPEQPKTQTPATPLPTVADASELPAPPPGSYLQVAATSLKDAQSMLALLQKNGHAGALASVPSRPGLVRVLVGPLATKEISAQKREELRKLGIENPLPQTYR